VEGNEGELGGFLDHRRKLLIAERKRADVEWSTGQLLGIKEKKKRELPGLRGCSFWNVPRNKGTQVFGSGGMEVQKPAGQFRRSIEKVRNQRRKGRKKDQTLMTGGGVK